MTSPMLDDQQYPHRWNDYIGQQRAKETLRVAAKSARIRRQPLDHVLIAHPQSGIGKTALAVLTAAELGRTTRIVSGPLGEDQARWLFSEMDDGFIVIHDEFHRMFEGGKRSWAWLLHYMQDQVLSGPLGMETQSRVTLVATTTEATSIPETVASRFMIKPQLVNYTDTEAARIAIRMSRDILGDLPDLGKRDAVALARGAANNPRAIRSLLSVLRDLTVTHTLDHADGHYDIAGLLRWEGVTPDGLDPVAQQYLIVLATELGGHAGERAMVDRLQQPGGLGSVERLLMERGLLAKTRSGRVLTKEGMTRTRALLDGQAA